MPGISFIGTKPETEEESKVAQVMKGVGAGVQAWQGWQEAEKERKLKERTVGIAESELSLKKTQLEHDYAKLDYDKRKDAYDSMVKLLPNVSPDKQVELTGSVEWTTLEDSLGLPHLSGIALSPAKPEPGWSNVEKVEAVRANLVRRRVGPKRDMYGISEAKNLETLTDAIDHITEEGLNPSLYTAELAGYQETPTIAPKGKGKGRQTSPYKEYPDAYLEGGKWKVRRGGKVYKIEE